jgi:hypothetical protein
MNRSLSLASISLGAEIRVYCLQPISELQQRVRVGGDADKRWAD